LIHVPLFQVLQQKGSRMW